MEEIRPFKQVSWFFLYIIYYSDISNFFYLYIILFRNHNSIHQAIYCFSKAIRCDHNDVDAIWDRSILYSEIGEFKKVFLF